MCQRQRYGDADESSWRVTRAKQWKGQPQRRQQCGWTTRAGVVVSFKTKQQAIPSIMERSTARISPVKYPKTSGLPKRKKKGKQSKGKKRREQTCNLETGFF